MLLNIDQMEATHIRVPNVQKVTKIRREKEEVRHKMRERMRQLVSHDEMKVHTNNCQ